MFNVNTAREMSKKAFNFEPIFNQIREAIDNNKTSIVILSTKNADIIRFTFEELGYRVSFPDSNCIVISWF